MLAWQSATGGRIPAGAQAAGYDSGDGGPLYVARANIAGCGLVLGKVRPGFGAAYFPYGGQELSSDSYQVLMNPNAYPNGFCTPGSGKGPWKTPQNPVNLPFAPAPFGSESKGWVPPWYPGGIAYAQLTGDLQNAQASLTEFHAIKCGEEQDGTPLFAALVEYQGGLHPGKVQLALGGANISWGGAEIQGQNPYSVLCDATCGFITANPSVTGVGVPQGSYGIEGSPFDSQDWQWYIARTFELPGIQLGMVALDLTAGALFSFGGQVYQFTNYQVLSSPSGAVQWIFAENGNIPDGAIVLGADENNEPLFAAMGGVADSGFISKIRHGFKTGREPSSWGC